jgi:enoyl-CoA hydratase/carnithine racemase
MPKHNNTITVKKNQQTAWITLNRPNKLNAINQTMLQELSEALDSIQTDPNTRCVIITGAAEKAFSAGADIIEMHKLTPETAAKFSTKGQQVFSKIENLSKPVIAAINGYCLGGGLEIALTCDFRIASDNSLFGFPEMKLGIIPAWGGTQRLPPTVGTAKAKQMIMLGDTLNAQEAATIGLVDKVVSKDKLYAEAEKLSQRLQSWSPEAIAHAKRIINSAQQQCLKEGLQKETDSFAQLFATKKTKEQIEAFWRQRNKK